MSSCELCGESRVCNDCGEEKPLSEFTKDKNNRHGHMLRCRVCHNARGKAWRVANPERAKERVRNAQRKIRMRERGITQADYDDIMEKQEGVCAICGMAPEAPARLAVDHDHETGEVRGLLCIPCNLAIGNLRDDPVLVLRAADYLMARVAVTIS